MANKQGKLTLSPGRKRGESNHFEIYPYQKSTMPRKILPIPYPTLGREFFPLYPPPTPVSGIRR